MKAKVTVRLKSGVLDPQGRAIQHAAESLGLQGIQEIRLGKVFDIELETRDEAQIEKTLETLATKILANPVMENYEWEIIKS